ncbi:transcription factor bHLH168-like [Ipomoea triloba]|uniref:transcription factor bHLH168-like n=1 Tax=Ipomoea triloba TaxID=35885 RepID=UPI00125D48E9|nr:transcription factor bHLH168-like [Ipomoea triloba]XP_031117855.1 transcription factor bHLH168-like [Ipomoea triloba]
MAHATETPPSSSGKLDRKTVERNRRIHMKNLCGKLVSLIPPQHLQPASSRELVSQQDQLDQAVTYIKQLKERVEKLKNVKKRKLVPARKEEEEEERCSGSAPASLKAPPILQVRDLGSSLEVNFISCCTKNFILHQVIKIVEEEGGQVVSAIFSTIGDKVFYTLHAQVKVTRLGMNTLEVYERLKKLIISQLPARQE